MHPRLNPRNFQLGPRIQDFRATLNKDLERPFSAFAAGLNICNPRLQDVGQGTFL